MVEIIKTSCLKHSHVKTLLVFMQYFSFNMRYLANHLPRIAKKIQWDSGRIIIENCLKSETRAEQELFKTNLPCVETVLCWQRVLANSRTVCIVDEQSHLWINIALTLKHCWHLYANWNIETLKSMKHLYTN